MKQQQYRPSQAAHILSVSPWTMRRWIREGRVPAVKSETGRLCVPAKWVEDQLTGTSVSGHRCAIYARESSSENKGALTSPLAGLRAYAAARGYQVVKEVQAIGSGMNDNRPKLPRLIEELGFDILLIEHKDRLTRFGLRWFEALSPFRIEVVNTAEGVVNNLMEDLVAIMTSFAARLYGQRRGRKKTEAAIRALQEAE